MTNYRLRCASLMLVSLLLAAASQAQIQVINSLITTFAGNRADCGGQTDSIGDGCPAASSTLRVPTGDALDSAGNLYIADANDSVIRKVSAATGEITTVAGIASSAGFSGDNGPATSATLSGPYGVAVDAAGDLFIVDQTNLRIREISAATGKISTVAGNGSAGYSGDNNQAINATFRSPFGIAVNPAGTVIYIGDSGNNVVRKVNLTTGIITTYAGNGDGAGSSFFNGTYAAGNGGAISVELWNPTGLALDSKGNLYIADTYFSVIREVSAATGNISTVAGNGTLPSFLGDSGDGGLATKGVLFEPNGVTVDAAGDLFIADTQNCLIREVNAATGIITTVVGDDANVGQIQGAYGGDNGPPLLASLNLPDDVAVDSAGNLYIADTQNNIIRKVTAPDAPLSLPPTNVGSTSTSQNVQLYITSYCTPGQVFCVPVNSLTFSSISVAPGLGGVREFTVGALSGCVADGATPTNADSICTVSITFNPAYPGLRQAPLEVVSSAGTFSFALSGIGMGPQAALIPGLITTVAGTGATGYTGDNGPATSATFSGVFDVSVDYAGNQYIDDYTNDVFRKVTAATGIITTFAGDGTEGYTGDYGPATGAELQIDWGAWPDGAGNLYIADTNNNVIREVNAITGNISTVVGACCAFNGAGLQGYNGDYIPAEGAELFFPESIAFDAAGNYYIADFGNVRVREVSAATGIITTVAGTGYNSGAGTGEGGYTGDNGPATSAELSGPQSVAVDTAGNIYIADSFNLVIRKVTAATGIITTVAGNGTIGDSGDNAPATSAGLAIPVGVVVDAAGDIYIDDGIIRKVDAATGIITTIAGGGTGCAGQTDSIGDGCGATSAKIGAQNLALDGAGNLYIADNTNDRVRKVSLTAAPITFPQTAVGSSSVAQTFKVANIGNAPMTLSAITPSANFTVDSSTTTCSTSDAVPSGDSCVIGVVFSPTAGGATTGTLTLTDDALNAPGATQQVALNAAVSATPDFTLTTSTPVVEVSQAGNAATFLFTVTSVNGFSGTIVPSTSLTPQYGIQIPASVTIPAGGSQGFNVVVTSVPALGAGNFPWTLTAATEGGLQHSVPVTLEVASPGLTPAVTVVPTPASITTAQALSATVTVAGGSGNPTPTGAVTLTSGSYSSGAVTLSGGSATINIPAGSLATSTDTLTASYTPDSTSSSIYTNATGSNVVAVTLANGGGPITASPANVNFGTVNVASTSSAVSVTLTFPSGVTLSKLAALTQGVANLDFAIQASGTTCVAGGQGADSSCTVMVTFSPIYPGPRLGALVLYDNSTPANAVATVYLTGIGQSPLFAILPGVMTTVAGNGTAASSGNGGQADSASLVPAFMALDGAGDIFVQDNAPGSALIRRVDAVTGVISPIAGGGSGCANQTDSLGDGCQATQASLNNSPSLYDFYEPIVLDGAGNLYTTNLLPSTSAASGYTWIVRKIDAATGVVTNVMPQSPSIPLCSGGVQPNTPSNGVCYLAIAAIDGSGTVYLNQTESNGQNDLLALSSQSSALTTVVSNIPTDQDAHSCGDVCLGGGSADGQGNLFLADLNGDVLKITLNTGASTAWIGPYVSCDGDYQNPVLLMDAAGDGYFAGSLSGINAEVVCEAGPTAQAPVYFAGTDNDPWPFNGDNIPATQANLANIADIVLDGQGNLYVSDAGNNRIRKDTVGTGIPVVFPSTAEGATSAPIDVTIQNIGNAPLSLSSIAVSPQFTISNSGTTCAAQGPQIAPGTTCVLEIEFAPTTTGTVTGTITIGDNSLNTASTSQVLLSGTATGAAATAPTVTVSPLPASITTTQGLSVTVTVGGTPTPTGSVTLTSGSYSSGAVTLSGGTATINIPAGSLSAGTDTLTASYTPDSASSATYTSATGSNTENVTAAATAPTVTVTPSPASITTAQALTVTITVGGTPTPTGSITLTSGTYSSGAITLSAGSATINIPAGTLAKGTDTLTASYTPDSASSASYTSATGSNTVTVTTPALITPTVTVTPGSSSITTAQALSVMVAVNGGNSNPTATGSITLTSGTYTSGAVTLSGGSATINIPAGSLATSTDTLTATYTPDSNSSTTYNSATGSNTVTVAAPPPITPTVTVTPGSSSITTAQALAVTVTVGGTPTPTGSITLTSGTYSSGAVTLSGGSATVNIPAGSLATSTDTLTATYTPDSNSSTTYNSATGSNTVTVAAPPPITPTVTVTPTSSSITSAQALAVTVTVGGTPTPTGSITLTSGTYSSGAVTLSDGSATINIAAGSLATGTDTLTATYSPDSSSSAIYNSATGSNTVAVTTAVAPTFALSSTTAPQTIQPGGSAQFTITATAQNGTFPGSVSLAASGIPAGATATFAPASITPGSSSANSTLSIQTASTAKASVRPSSAWPLAAPALALIGLCVVPGKRRRRWITMTLLLIASLGAFTALTACSGGFRFQTPSQSYTITITGTSGAETQTTTVQLTVQ